MALPKAGDHFEPVKCFVVTDISEWWRHDVPDDEWPWYYACGAILDKRGSDGEGNCWVISPMGSVDLNNPKQRWALSGMAPKLTASPSIKVGPVEWGPDRVRVCWHGYLRDGVLTGNWE